MMNNIKPAALLGVHSLVFAPGWSRREAQTAVEGAVACGFDILEIPMSEEVCLGAEWTRTLIERSGLVPVCSLGLDSSTDIASDDRDTVSRGEQRLAKALESAHLIGSELLTGITYGAMGHHTRRATRHGRQSAQEVLARVATAARERAMRIGVEVVNRYESNLLNTAEEGLAFIGEIDADNLVLHLDTYHMNIEETDFRSPALAAGNRLGYVHVGESHRGYLGTGTVDFASFFQALTQIGYGGAVTFEGFSAVAIGQRLAGALAIWRETWQDGTALARHAHDFLARETMTWSQPPAARQ